MLLTFLKSKIHRATVTQADLHYEGSISIDVALMEAAGMHAGEQVDVLSISNGERFTTYAIEAPRNSGTITINGAAAHLVAPGDMVIICCYVLLEPSEVKAHEPVVVLVDEENKVTHG